MSYLPKGRTKLLWLHFLKAWWYYNCVSVFWKCSRCWLDPYQTAVGRRNSDQHSHAQEAGTEDHISVALKVNGYVLQSAAEVVFGCEVDYATLEQVTACWCSLGHSIQTLLSPCLVCVVCVSPHSTINQAPVHIFFVPWVPAVSVTCKCTYATLSKIGEERHERDLQVQFSSWWQLLFFSSVGYAH